jgi:hypothetical protein
MASHFQVIGVEDFRAFMQHAYDHGEWQPLADGGRTVVYRDASGASVVVWTTPENEVADAAPSFAATSRIDVANPALYFDADQPFSSVASVEVFEDGETLYPLVTALENTQELFGDAAPDRAVLTVSAFAEEIAVWPDPVAYAREETEEAKLDVRSFVPAGMFVERAEDVTARGLITGIVGEAALRRNEATGGEFVHAVVATHGMAIDCLFAREDVPDGLAGGMVVQGTFWLIGRLHRP